MWIQLLKISQFFIIKQSKNNFCLPEVGTPALNEEVHEIEMSPHYDTTMMIMLL